MLGDYWFENYYIVTKSTLKKSGLKNNLIRREKKLSNEITSLEQFHPI